MKKNYIIPIFIPHLGCPNDCIFCNQKKIAKDYDAQKAELSTLVAESDRVLNELNSQEQSAAAQQQALAAQYAKVDKEIENW